MAIRHVDASGRFSAPPMLEAALRPAGIHVFDVLGAGKQGETFLGRVNEQTVVIKMAPLHIAQREIGALRRIGDTKGKTPTLLFHTTSGQTGIFAMTKGGRSLSKELVERSKNDPEIAVAIAMNLLRSLRSIHRAGVVHGDVTRNNFLVEDDASNKVMLIDFGLARTGGEPLLYRKPPRASMAAPDIKDLGKGGALPTSAPTQDLFSAGVHLSTLASGFPPFAVDATRVNEAKAWLDVYATGPQMADSLDPSLKGVIRTALSFDPKRRYQKAQEFIDALRPLSAQPTRSGAGFSLSGNVSARLPDQP